MRFEPHTTNRSQYRQDGNSLYNFFLSSDPPVPLQQPSKHLAGQGDHAERQLSNITFNKKTNKKQIPFLTIQMINVRQDRGPLSPTAAPDFPTPLTQISHPGSSSPSSRSTAAARNLSVFV